MNPLEVSVSSSAKWERWNHNPVSQIIGARCASGAGPVAPEVMIADVEMNIRVAVR